MLRRSRTLVLIVGLACGLPAAVGAQDLAGLRPEWTVEPASSGRARVVGYLYNRNIMDGANVLLRVDRIGSDGAVTGTYRRRVMGDVLSGGRSLFDVPVAEAGTYRVTVEAVDWVKECR
ncbi:MAG TPA: hypothetical protein VID28_03070 [Methylomirabilota bacterium]|jgi:hypothetical protein